MPKILGNNVANGAEAIQETRGEVRSYMKEHPEFAEIGQRILREWENGVNTSLRG